MKKELMTINSEQGSILMDIARSTMDRFVNLKSPLALAGGDSPDTDPCHVYVTLWARGEIRGFGTSHFLPQHAGVERATLSALDVAVRGTPLMLSELDEVSIEISVRQSVMPVVGTEEQKGMQQTGNAGLSLLHRGGWFDLLPGKIIRRELDAEAQREYLLSQASISDQVIKDPGWYVSEWNTWVEHKGKVFPVFRGRTQVPLEMNEKNCLLAAEQAAARLMIQQNVLGQYTYEYRPFENIVSNEDYNLVRLAGTTFSMTMLSAMSENKKEADNHRRSAKHALHYLLELAQPSRLVPGGIYVAQEHYGLGRMEGKLGTSALVLLALQFGDFYNEYADQREGLIKTITAMQHAGGDFACFVPPVKELGDHSGKSCQNYFPGEALLAFAYELKRGFRKDVAESMIQAFGFYRDHFAQAPHTAFVLWQASAWALFHELLEMSEELEILCQEKNITTEDIARFVYDQADFILDYQHTENTTERVDYLGGFPNSGAPGSVSSCYLEAVIRAAHLAWRLEDTERAERYTHASVEGLKFLNRLQVKEEESYLFRRPSHAIGGITGNLSSFKLRNDRDQHAITAYLAAVETPCLFNHKESHLISES